MLTAIHPSGGASRAVAARPAAPRAGTAGASAATRGSALAGDTAAVGARRSGSALIGGSEKEAEGAQQRTEALHTRLKDDYASISGGEETQLTQLKKLAETAHADGVADGHDAGKKAERGALAWKIPLTLFSGVIGGLIPAWYIASKDDKTIKRLNDQLAAAQAN